MRTHVLVIEDNAINLELLVYALKAFGHEVQSATSGITGLEMAQRDPPALILCDIQMPGMDGYQFAKTVKTDPALEKVPLVGVSALAMVGDRDKAMLAGFDDYLAKPVDFEALQQTLARFGIVPGQTCPRENGPVSELADGVVRPASSRPEKILVVDDVSWNLDIKKCLLEPLGFHVLTAFDMETALSLARAHRPALIISDVGMRTGTGYDFIREVKADPLLRDAPFMFLTATHATEADRQRGLALGASRYLLRPIDMQDLLHEIEGCLERR
ncbi:MAG: response regulator [Aquabacterium sp.]